MTTTMNKVSRHSLMKKKNMRLIIEYFRENACSTFQIGKEIGLSSGGAKKLVDDIADGGLIVRVPSVRRFESGRTPLSYEINPNYRRVLIVNYADATVSLLDLCGNVVEVLRVDDVFDSEDSDGYILDTIEQIKAMLSRHTDVPLGVIALVYVGKFDKQGNCRFSGMFKNITLNIYETFKKEFGVEVIAHNDLQFALMAERRKGVFKGNEESACLFNIGRGVSCSIMINDKLYVGANGIAGEVGQNLIIGNQDVRTTNEDYISWWRIKRKLEKKIENGEQFALKEGFNHADAVIAYKNGDPIVREIVDCSAKNMARLLKNITDLMDFGIIILTGKMLEFGDDYYQLLIDEYQKIGRQMFNSDCYAQVRIVRAERNEDEDILTGAFECARDKVFEDFVQSRLSIRYETVKAGE